jgi:CubicO group peptidase (beta-lactamase class C family)
MRSKRLVIALVPLLALTAACRPRPSEKPAGNPYQRRLEPLVQDLVRRQEIPGLAIALVDDGRVVYARGFGTLDAKRAGEPVTPRSLFHMASITKTFVATAVMQLVEKGRMRLDAPITTYLPYFRMADPRAGTITIEQLLTHTSGMPDVADYAWDKPEYDDGALERYVRSLAKLQLVFAPGDRFQYSNIAYEILGDAVAKVSGTSFDDYVHQNILVPLAMRDSTLLVKEADPKLMTWGHELDGSGKPFMSHVYPYNRAHTPSSNLHSNVLDMTRWAAANLDGGELDGRRILTKATLDRMWRAARQIASPGPDERREAIGLSWFLGEHRGKRIVSHGGGDTGYVTDLVLIPEGRKAVVWMANVDWMDHDPLTNASLDVLMGLTPGPIAAKRSVGRVMVGAYGEGGLDAALARYAALKANQPDLYELGEGELNGFGYFLVGEKHVDEALRVFRMNVEAFPKSANAQDSLGEAYELAGDKAGAAAAYEQAIKLDPGFKHAADALAKLKSPGS